MCEEVHLNLAYRWFCRLGVDGNAPAALKRELIVQPFGFFCLRQTRQSHAREDYALLPLLEDTVYTRNRDCEGSALVPHAQREPSRVRHC